MAMARVRGKPIPTAWTEPARPATGRATQRELEKRARREGERIEAGHHLMAPHFGDKRKASNSNASALSNNNKI
eukprot:jgi/Tetstr1/430322/TSEL_020147.t1